MNFTLKVWRQQNAKAKGHFETYKVSNISPDTSFLEMLDILNDQLIREGNDPVAVNKGCILTDLTVRLQHASSICASSRTVTLSPSSLGEVPVFLSSRTSW